MGSVIKARFPLLLLLGIVFLASVSVSFGLAYWEKENPSHDKCLKSCNRENDAYRHHACQARCNLIKNTIDSQEERKEQQPRHQGQEQEEHDPREQEQEQEQEQERRRQQQQEQEQEQEQERRRKEEQQQEEREQEEEAQEEKQREKKREQQEEREQEEQSRRQKNPYHFRSNRFQTLYKNQYGQIRVLQRFDQRSKKLQNLQNYRIVEFELKPNTLFGPHHSDAEFFLVVLGGKATITILFPEKRESYNLDHGDALRLPAGNAAYLLNRDDNQNLKVVELAIPVNKPGKFEYFFPSLFLDGFSRNTLKASYNTPYEEIQRILLADKKQEQEQQESQEEGVIVQVSEELIRELTKHAKSSSKKGKHSESGPFNLRSSNPIYSNKFGKFYEVTPDKNPQLQDLGIALTCAEINEGALLLPHYNSKAIVVFVVNEGEGRVELVGLRKQEQEEQEEEEGNRQVHRYTAKLSQGDIFVIPASYPVAINASSNLHLLGFGINAENNLRNFLAGENDNVISQIQRQVKELAFPGSSKEVESLLKNQKHSYFANAKPQQREEGREGRRGPLSSILGTFY